VPHGQIARVEVSAVERASRRVGILKVTVHDDVPAHDDLADRFAVAGDVDELFARLRRGTDDAERERGREGVSLASDEFGPLGGGERCPRRLQVVASERPIRLAVVFVGYGSVIKTGGERRRTSGRRRGRAGNLWTLTGRVNER